MAENRETYWQQWEKLLEAAATIQGLLPGMELICHITKESNLHLIPGIILGGFAKKYPWH